jgi:hypothetical protein
MNEDQKDQKEQEKSWPKEVEEILAEQALAMNYEYGVTTRILPGPTEGETHSFRLMLDLTHGGSDIDLEWILTFTDNRADAVLSRLMAPESAGGELRQERYASAEAFRKAVKALPYFVHGFMAGRASRVESQGAEVYDSETR